MCRETLNRNSSFVLTVPPTVALEPTRRTFNDFLRNLLVLGFVLFLFTGRGTAQVLERAPQRAPVAAVPNATTDEATERQIEELVKRLGGKRPQASSAASALVKIGRAAVQPLTEATEDENHLVRAWAVHALGEIGDPQAIPTLIEALADEDVLVASWAIRAFGKIGQPAIEPLIANLGGRGSRGRPYAASALGETGDRRAVQPLIRALADEEQGVRQHAVKALDKIGDPLAVPALIKVLQDANPYTRQCAVKALGTMRDLRAVPELIGALEDRDSTVQQLAASALGGIGQPTVQRLVRVLENENPTVRRHAAGILARIGDPQSVLPFIKALEDEDLAVREHAARTLGKIGDPRAVPPLIEALEDRKSGVRGLAAHALGEFGDPRSVRPLAQALKDKDGALRLIAASALRRIDDPRAAEALRRKASANEPRLVVSFVIGPLILCLPLFLAAGIVLVLKYKSHVSASTARSIFVYLGAVTVLTIAPVVILNLAALEKMRPDKLLLVMTVTCGALLYVGTSIVEGVFGLHSQALCLWVGCLVYYGVGFLPLLGALRFKKVTIKILCIAVQVSLVVLHFYIHFRILPDKLATAF